MRDAEPGDLMAASYVDELHERFSTDISYKSEDVPLNCVPPVKELEATLHGVMKLNGLVIRSLEEIAGRGANAVTFRAGKKFGHEVAKYFQKREDIEDALHELSDLLQGQYSFEVWKPADSDTFLIEEGGRGSSISCFTTASFARHCGETGRGRPARSARPSAGMSSGRSRRLPESVQSWRSSIQALMPA